MSTHDQPVQNVPVLVVGAGLGGLSTAMFLGTHGVAAMVVDRHPGTSRQPKARGQSPTMMEAFAAAGIADDIVAANPPGRPEMTIVICDGVFGTPINKLSESFPDFGAFSPAPYGMASQQRAEAILASRAVALGADLRFSTRLESFRSDDDGVHAVLRDLATDREYRVEARYLVAADGHKGEVGRAAGIGYHSRGGFGPMTTTLFRADLADRLPDSAVLLYYVQNPALPGNGGTFVSTDVPGEYVMGMSADPDRTDAQTVEAIRAIIGVPGLEVTPLGSSTWEIAHRVADRYSAGRVLLVGDAAHLMPPTGGQGGNLAMSDGLALGWRLAAVVRGAAGPGLLDSYDAEQRPIGDAVADWQYANMYQRIRPDLAGEGREEPMDPARLAFGYRMPAGAFVAEPGDGEVFEDPTAPSGRPGTRAPHVWLERDGAPVSTRDLFFRGFVLLTGSAGWVAAASAVGTVPVAAYRIGGELSDPDGAWAAAYGVPAGGAVLVRPDGIIAWRTAGPADPAALDGALRRVLSR